LIEKVVNDALAARDHSDLAKTIADKCKEALKDLKKDARYKFMVQVTVGQNNGQGFRSASRHFWDEDTDDVVHFSAVTDQKFVLVVAYAIYMY